MSRPDVQHRSHRARLRVSKRGIVNEGAPTKFTPETCRRLIELRRELVPITHCCDAVGISYPTLENWRHDTDPAHVAFFLDLNRAEAEGIESRMKIIRDAAKAGNWQAAAWQLERMFPDEFGQRRDFPPEQLAVIIQNLLTSLRVLLPDVRQRRELALALKGDVAALPAPAPQA